MTRSRPATRGQDHPRRHVRQPARRREPVIPAAEYLARLYRRPGAAATSTASPRIRTRAGQGDGGAGQAPAPGRPRGRQRVDCGSPRSAGPPAAPPSSLNPGPPGQADRLTRPTATSSPTAASCGSRRVDWFSWRDGPDTGPRCDWCRRPACWPRTATPKPRLQPLRASPEGPDPGPASLARMRARPRRGRRPRAGSRRLRLGHRPTQTSGPAGRRRSRSSASCRRRCVAEDDLDRMAQGKVGTIRFVIPWAALGPRRASTNVDFSTIDPLVLGRRAARDQGPPDDLRHPELGREGLDHFQMRRTAAVLRADESD